MATLEEVNFEMGSDKVSKSRFLNLFKHTFDITKHFQGVPTLNFSNNEQF